MILIDRPFSNIFYLLILLIFLWGRNSWLHFTDEEAVLRECKWTDWGMASSRALIPDQVLFGENYSVFCMSFCSDLKIQEVRSDLNTLSYKIMRLPRWLSGKKKNLPAKQETQVWSLGWEIPWGRNWQPTPAFCLGNRMDRGAWWATDHGADGLDTTERLSTAHNLCLDSVLWILSYAYYLCHLT